MASLAEKAGKAATNLVDPYGATSLLLGVTEGTAKAGVSEIASGNILKGATILCVVAPTFFIAGLTIGTLANATLGTIRGTQRIGDGIHHAGNAASKAVFGDQTEKLSQKSSRDKSSTSTPTL